MKSKKILTIIAIVVILGVALFVLTGCGNNENSNNNKNNSTSSDGLAKSKVSIENKKVEVNGFEITVSDNIRFIKDDSKAGNKNHGVVAAVPITIKNIANEDNYFTNGTYGTYSIKNRTGNRADTVTSDYEDSLETYNSIEIKVGETVERTVYFIEDDYCNTVTIKFSAGGASTGGSAEVKINIDNERVSY